MVLGDKANYYVLLYECYILILITAATMLSLSNSITVSLLVLYHN